MEAAEMEKGGKYTIISLIPPQRKSRRHLMTYLGSNKWGERQFSARPAAGTQTLKDEWILAIAKADSGAEHYVNRTVYTPSAYERDKAARERRGL